MSITAADFQKKFGGTLIHSGRIPEPLKKLRQWVNWKVETRDGKPTKVPKNPVTGLNADVSDPLTWAAFTDALGTLEKHRDLAGIGFVFTAADPYCGADCDCARNSESGEIEKWAEEIITQLRSYTEISPSGTGLHIILTGKLPTAGRKKGDFEAYDSGRFFTVTGAHLPSTPATIEPRQQELLAVHARIFGSNGHKPKPGAQLPLGEPSTQNHETNVEDQELLRKARAASNGAKFRALWSGELTGYPSQSEADLVLCSLLSFWTSRNALQIDRLFRKSGLFREKWDTRRGAETYGTWTINRAFASTSEVYRPERINGHTINADTDSTETPEPASQVPVSEPAENQNSGPAENLAPHLSEDALALTFSAQYADDLRYVARWGQWLRWNETHWRHDHTLAVFDLARHLCREAVAEIKKTALAKKIARAATVAAVERLARSDRRHAATIEQWDADQWLLNTPTGTLDLRTGEQREHRREDSITKCTSAGLGDGACVLWSGFLERITNGDAELQAFLQRIAGYCLTGSIREHAMFFLYGTGANGKTVFLSTIADLLGEYAKTAPITTFMATGNEQHPTDLAGLCGARLVTALETEDGRRWAEAKIKMLTGGDRIAARFMRQDFFEFSPQFKLLIAGNHKPGLRSVDEAIRRRLYLIPFAITIPSEERDRELPEKLRVEWPAILRWAVDGCREWQQRGLNPPEVVLDATAKYLADEDRFTLWLEERCDVDARYSATAGELFRSWVTWCESREEKPGSQKSFSQTMESHGFEGSHSRAGNLFNGMRTVHNMLKTADGMAKDTDLPVEDRLTALRVGAALTSGLGAAIKEYLAGRTDGYLFQTSAGNPWDKDDFRARKLNPLLACLEIPKIDPKILARIIGKDRTIEQANRSEKRAASVGLHSFRHTNATAMDSLGIQHAIRKQRLGHSGNSVTENYTHTFTQDERGAAEKLGELFGTGWPEKGQGKVISFPNLSQTEKGPSASDAESPCVSADLVAGARFERATFGL